MSENTRVGPALAEGAVLDSAIGALSAEGKKRVASPHAPAFPGVIPAADGAAPLAAFDRVGLSVSVGAVRRFAMTVSGRIEGRPGGPGFDPAAAHAVCTITDRHAPDEPPLEGTLKMGEDGRFTFTVLLEAWPEDRYPRGRLFVITVRARDRAGTLGTSTTYLRVPPPAPGAAVPPRAASRLPAAVPPVPHDLLADALARARPASLPLYVKGLHLAVKELKEERQPDQDASLA